MKASVFGIKEGYAAEYSIQRRGEVPALGAAYSPGAVAALWSAWVEPAPWARQEQEQLVCFVLNTRRVVCGFFLVGLGTLDSLSVHPREVFRPALMLGASAIVIAHNHPSGDPTPSDADIRVTRDLMRAGQLLKVELLDHLIIGHAPDARPAFTSLRELGLFYS